MNSLPLKMQATSAVPMAKGTSPRKKLPGGMSAPLHVVEGLELVVALEKEAYEAMGSDTKPTPSEYVSEALEEWLVRWVARFGPLPYEKSERAAYVKRLVEFRRAESRAQLTNPKV